LWVRGSGPERLDKRQRRRRGKFAKATRSSEHGVKGFYLRFTTGVIAQFDATVA